MITSRGRGQLHRRSKKIAWQGHGPCQHVGSRPQLTSGARCRNRGQGLGLGPAPPVLLHLSTVIKDHDGPQQQPVAAVVIHPLPFPGAATTFRALGASSAPVGGSSAAICHQGHLPAPEPVAAPLFKPGRSNTAISPSPHPPFPSIRALLVLGGPPPIHLPIYPRQFSLFSPDMQPILPRPGPETHLVHDPGPSISTAWHRHARSPEAPPPHPPPGRGCDGSADDSPRQVASSSASGPPDQRTGLCPRAPTTSLHRLASHRRRPIQSPPRPTVPNIAEPNRPNVDRSGRALRVPVSAAPLPSEISGGDVPPYQVQGRMANRPFSLPTAPRRSIAPSRCELGEARSAWLAEAA